MARTPIHPGEILADELDETGLSAAKLADVLKAPPNRLYQLLAGKRSITADTALRLSQYFGMSADFWMNLQSAYELDMARQQNGKAIRRIPKRTERAAVDQSGLRLSKASPRPRHTAARRAMREDISLGP
jgi:addiction module HigA family antidote